MVRLEPRRIGRFDDRHCQMGREQIDHHAGMIGVKMLHQHEGHAAPSGQGAEEGAKRLEPAGGSSDANHGKVDVGLCDHVLARASALTPLNRAARG